MNGSTNKHVSDASLRLAGEVSISDEMQRRFTEKRWVWVPDCKEGYISGFVVKEDGDALEVDCGGIVTRYKSCEIFRMNPPKFDMIDDLAELSYLNEPGVLHNLRRRYQNGRIYTYSGLFLLAINPYKDLRIYGEKDVRKYTLSKKYELEPHIFAVANEAYRLMVSNRENQSILITGESGAGKTENTKRVVEFLATVGGSRGEESSIDRKIIDANPILEAFGNAQTVKNDNSSRFGKFIKIKFNGGNICGAHIEKYLLEKSRVTNQSKDERNYHIFYQLLGCDDPGLKKQLLLDGEPKDYRFLRNSRYKIEDVDDAKEFRRLRESMDVLNIRKEEQEGYFGIVSAILHLGNIEFREKDGAAEIANLDVAEKVCKLLSIPLTEFIKRLIHPMIKAGNEYVAHSRSREQALKIVDGLARILYDKMFDNVIDRINMSLSSPHKGNFIGVLDIAGFEIFDKNSFEQLCINYTNEKLQQFFNHHMFILEQEVYRQEKIEWDFIDFGLDLQPTIDLIEKSNPIGILSYLDEECVMPMATEKTFLRKLMGNIRHEKFEVDKIRDAFVLNHYAGDVEYTVDDWLSKNKDSHSEALTSLIRMSNSEMVSKLSLDEEMIKKGFFRTVSQKHKEQLGSLMCELRGTNPHFVRCIIPNLEKSGSRLDNGVVLGQLKCNGVLEGIRISRQGFPSRMGYQEFVQRYRIMMRDKAGSDEAWDDGVCVEFCKEMSEKILSVIGIGTNQYRMGRTKVFFRQGVLADIEDMRDSRISEVVKEIQALVRRKLAFRKYNLTQRRMEGILVIQRNSRICCELQRWNWWRLYQKIKPLLDVRKRDNEMKEKEAMIQEYIRMLDAEKGRREEAEEMLKEVNLKKEALEKCVKDEKRFSMEKDELLMALRYKADEMGQELERIRKEKGSIYEEKKVAEARLKESACVLEERESEISKLKKEVEEQGNVILLHEGEISSLREEIVSKSSEKDAMVERMLRERDSEVRMLKEKIKEKDLEARSVLEKMKRIETEDEERRRELKEKEMTINELKTSCLNMKRWKDECAELREDYETMQRKLKDEAEDMLLENDRLHGEIRKMKKEQEELESMQKKLRDDLEFERNRGNKVERAFQELRKEHEAVEEQLQKEKQSRDSTQESLLEKTRSLERKVKSLSEKLKNEEIANKQLMNEKDEMYKEIHVLQQSKLDEIFDREATFNSIKKNLQMEIQRLEMENQRLGMEMMESKCMGDASEDSSVIERFYGMVEEERKKRKEAEHLVSEQENKNVILSSEVEMLREMVEMEKRGKEEMMRVQEKEAGLRRMISGIRKEIEDVGSEMSIAIEGFNGLYFNTLEEYKRDLRECRELLATKDDAIEELKDKVSRLNCEVEERRVVEDEMNRRIEELKRQHSNALDELTSLGVKCSTLELSVSEKEEEIKRYGEKCSEYDVRLKDLVCKVDEEIEGLRKCDEERRRYVERLEEGMNGSLAGIRKLEERYKARIEESVQYALEGERRKLKALEELHGQLTKKFDELQEEHQNLLDEKMKDSLRIEQLDGELCALREVEMHRQDMISMYESEISTLKRCTKFKDEVLGTLSGERSPSVVYVCDKEKYQALERKRTAAENELVRTRDEKQSQVLMNKKLRDELEKLRAEVDESRSKALEMKKKLGCQVLAVNRLSRELEEEKEMVRFLKIVGGGRKKKM
ncbi:myosin heavy chain [Encephalitozoon hellem ATCC 50504]|uniref:Myosin heavy chain n=1 Tax=Encephalitozoon hellem TaxID=27973 RepID=A0A9Q9C5N9_ENCHE|nr:myosin heavy chain [Encephalitozoon hellem ATCC 50504]AFM98142.1 myosin heavy chain [Encephalitozoon hellem ATCC 50504]UTX42987.1 myosin heavy chain [Encephalitozoon hellem]|eukprot:XP_003887123.1 myosin heavy chain [Encephalitozoon hellem ATCC 50504]